MLRSLAGRTARFILNRLDSPALVLLYHRVTHLESDPQQLSVTPENFYDQVSFLKNNYALLGIEEFADLLSGRKKMPPKAAILSFDDGYADNCEEALPILESLKAQALFFITTSLLDTSHECWWDELERIFLDNRALPPFLEMQGTHVLTPLLPPPASGSSLHEPGLAKLRLSTANNQERKYIYDTLHPLLKFTAPPERDRLIRDLQQWAGLSPEGRPTHRMMTTQQLVKMGSSPSAVIGAHTHNHPALSILPYKDQQAEISLSQQILQKALGRNIFYFAYPFGGKKDYNDASVKACLENGFTLAFSNHYGQVHSWTHPFRIPRMLIRDWNREPFSVQIEKLFKY
jgi:peptidoglycan/xylan/chitin deacetylase (PgdA/CDA1 family)